MNNIQKRMRKQAGMTIPAVMVFMATTAIVGIAVMSGTMTSNRLSDRTSAKSQSNLLAESAVQKLYDTVRDSMRDNGGYPLTMPRENVTVATLNGDRVSGWHEATIIKVDQSVEDVNDGSGEKVRRTLYIFTIEGRSQSQYGIAGIVRAKFSAIRDLSLVRVENVIQTGEGADQIMYPAGAIVANNKVEFVTDNGVRVYSPDGKSGHVIANQGISWNTRAGDKNRTLNPNAIDVQGLMVTTNNVKSWTEGRDGIGNSNGSKNYKTAGFNDGGLTVPANSVFGVDESISFANPATVDGWVRQWQTLTNKPHSTKYPAGVKSAEIVGRTGDQWKVISAPAYINGDLDIRSGDLVRLMPNSSNPAQNVIYVNGNVKNMGSLLNLGVTIVFTGKYTDSESSQYKLDTQGSPLSSNIRTLLQSSAMISANASADAIKMKTNSSTTTGVIYSAKGGVQIEGNAEMRGMLLAGGLPPIGNVSIRPNGGNSFVVHYEPDAAGMGDYTPNINTQIDVKFVAGGVKRPFTPTKLRDWERRK